VYLKFQFVWCLLLHRNQSILLLGSAPRFVLVSRDLA
jgi:hypothetical protein